MAKSHDISNVVVHWQMWSRTLDMVPAVLGDKLPLSQGMVLEKMPLSVQKSTYKD